MLQYVVGDAILLHFCDALQGGQYNRSHQQDDFEDMIFAKCFPPFALRSKREYIIESGGDAVGWESLENPSFVHPFVQLSRVYGYSRWRSFFHPEIVTFANERPNG